MNSSNSANLIALVSTSAYFVLFILHTIHSLTKKSYGELDFTRAVGFVVLIILAILLAVINYYYRNLITVSWIKNIAYSPILFLAVVIIFGRITSDVFNLANSDNDDFLLTIELKSSKELNNGSYWSRSSSGASGGKLEAAQENALLYKFNTRLYKEDERFFTISSDDFDVELNINEIPERTTSFTKWKAIEVVLKDAIYDVQLQYRYKVKKLH